VPPVLVVTSVLFSRALPRRPAQPGDATFVLLLWRPHVEGLSRFHMLTNIGWRCRRRVAA
jgi:hypothetical protein